MPDSVARMSIRNDLVEELERTVRKSLNNLGQNQGQIFWSCTKQHANKDGIRFYSGIIKDNPWHIDNSIDKYCVRSLQLRYDVRESDKPKTDLRSL